MDSPYTSLLHRFLNFMKLCHVAPQLIRNFHGIYSSTALLPTVNFLKYRKMAMPLCNLSAICSNEEANVLMVILQSEPMAQRCQTQLSLRAKLSCRPSL